MLRNPGLRKSVEQPVLDLNFAVSQIGSNAAPDSRIDFSRGSNAWFVDTDGLVKKSPHNLILQSEDFGTSWTANGDVTVATNEIVAPDGTTTADKISSANFGSGANHVRQQVNLPSGTVNMSVFVKQGNLDNFQFRTITFNPSTSDVSSIFTYSSASWTSLNANHTNAFVESYGNGWYRIGFDVNNPATGATGGVEMRLSEGSGNGFAYIWGAQISQHTTLPVDNPYIKTTGSAVYAARLDHDPTWFMSAAQEQNLEAHSEDLASAEEFLVRASVTDNDTTAPDGTTTADKLVVDGTANNDHYIRFSYEALPSTAVTFSLHARADELNEFGIKTFGSLGFENSVASTFNLSAGTVSKHANHTNATIEALDDGWFRVSVTENTDSDIETRTIQVQLMSGGSADFDGDSTSGMHFWGLQFEVGSAASTYHRTEGAPYYGEGATPKGLLIEEQRTNDATQSEIFTGQNGCTVVSNNNLAPDGTTTADTATLDTTTGSKQVKGSPNPTNTNSVSYALSVFAKLINGTPNLAFRGYGNGGVNAYPIFDLANKTVVRSGTAWSNAKVEDYGNGWLRCSAVTTASNTNGPLVQFLASGDETGTSTYKGNGTDAIAFWGLQQEVGSFPTSYIKTTGSSATRNADVATMGPTTGGTELVTNGTFDTDSDWIVTSDASITGGELVYNSAGQFKNTDQVIAGKFIAGRRYRFSCDVTSYTSGTFKVIYLEGSTNQGDVTSTSTGSVTFDFTCVNDNPGSGGNRIRLQSFASSNNTFAIDNVSVRELYPFEQYNPSKGTMVCEFERFGTNSFGRIWELNDNTNQNTMILLTLNDNSIYFAQVAQGSQQLEFQNIGVLPGEKSATAFAYQHNNFHISMATNGVLERSFEDTNCAVPAVDRLGIGYPPPHNSSYGNSHIKRLTYFPYRLANDVCDSKVTS